MTPAAPPVFGKRTAFGQRTATAAATPLAPVAEDEQAAFFAAVRREIHTEVSTERVVPRAFGAALMSGLVVGFCLAGLDITRANAMLHDLAGETGAETSQWLPVLILVALLGGARAAATSLLVAHWALRRLGLTHHIAYTLAGGLVAAGVSAIIAWLIQSGLVDAAMLPTHGVAIDTAAGAGAGFVYRVFAGARPA